MISHQFGAELLFEPLFVSREDGGIFETSHSLRDEDIETVLHGEHQQRPEGKRNVRNSNIQTVLHIAAAAGDHSLQSLDLL